MSPFPVSFPLIPLGACAELSPQALACWRVGSCHGHQLLAVSLPDQAARMGVLVTNTPETLSTHSLRLGKGGSAPSQPDGRLEKCHRSGVPGLQCHCSYIGGTQAQGDSGAGSKAALGLAEGRLRGPAAPRPHSLVLFLLSTPIGREEELFLLILHSIVRTCIKYPSILGAEVRACVPSHSHLPC